MVDGGRKKIETHLNVGYTSNIEIGGINYSVVTDKLGLDEVAIVSTVYLKGKAVSRRKEEYGNKLDPMNIAEVEAAVRKLHFDVLTDIEAGKDLSDKKPRDYIEETRKYLRRRNNKSALNNLREAYGLYPDDPYILSYYGYLISAVDKKHEKGIEFCQRALDKLGQKFPVGLDSAVKPLFFLNLCRAQQAAGDKKSALDTIYSALRFDSEEGMLNNELVKLGIRRKPFIPFLKRSNPINKYIGKMLYKADD